MILLWKLLIKIYQKIKKKDKEAITAVVADERGHQYRSVDMNIRIKMKNQSEFMKVYQDTRRK